MSQKYLLIDLEIIFYLGVLLLFIIFDFLIIVIISYYILP